MSNAVICIYIYVIDQAQIKMAGYWLSFFFFRDKVESRKPIFWFHKEREITKNLFTLAENNFSERKLLCTCLNFGEILFAGMKQAVPSGQYRSILPTRVAHQNAEFAAYCPLAELAI